MSSSTRRRSAVPLVLAAVAALSSTTACSNSGGGAPSSTSSPAQSAATSASTNADTARITIKNFAFSPATSTVKAGEKVTVVNEDSAAHTVTASEGGAFDTGSIASGKSVSFTAPSKAGSYAFICTFHPNMKGTLTVR
ncbi:cupredoxin domain-containing protein [Streptomyces sp. 142MFCol3.1]|uniref:cupredoxin domain-containing protein n=1 Tax=Streptomyces sp. 142MFCol3.1 TaxID=1172179 RepID=UPI001F424313|nr:cupredoxin domain-containing protein [Streptomyces sp. 142MFCol3.1]